MKKYFLMISIGISIISLLIFSCKKEIEDEDLLTGKWVRQEIQNDTTKDICEKRSYIEFSEYVLDIRNRIYSFNNICDTVERVIGNYTIEGNTLFIKDTMNVSSEFTIDYINPVSMSLSEPDINVGGSVHHKYLRVKE